MERRVFCAGEILYDIIFEHGLPVSASPGGALLNTAVSLARAGYEAYPLSEISNDLMGNLLEKFFRENEIHSDYILKHDEGQTALAIAFLDENKDAQYDIYKLYPEGRFDVRIPDFSENDILMFGSSFGIDTSIRKKLIEILTAAKSAGAMIIYDPNYRKSFLEKDSDVFAMIKENMMFADLVRGSEFDFNLMLQKNNPYEIYDEIKNFCRNFIYTKGEEGAFVLTGKHFEHYPVNKVEVVSTIGAGDSFNAGLASGLIDLGINRDDLDELDSDKWRKIINKAFTYSTEVVQSFENFIKTRK